MLESTRKRLLESIGPDDIVLDIGGWADPFERADWVIDLMPFETRGLYARQGWIDENRSRPPERFGRETWIQRDLCDREEYPFENDSIDFVICSQTLEDLRDPLWVCREMQRIGKSGYIEVPSRLEEQSWGVAGPYVGWPHHRWLVDVGADSIEFVVKLHSLHARPDQYFPAGFVQSLREDERIQTLRWNGGFSCRERVIVEPEEMDRYLADFVARERVERSPSSAGERAGIRAQLRAFKRGLPDRLRQT